MTSRRRFFDEMASRWDELHPAAPQAPAIERGLDLAGDLAGRTVLDIGCGTGILAPFLLRRIGEGRLFALDASGPMVTAAAARHRDPRLAFLVGDLHGETLPAALDAAGLRGDAVLVYNTFPHFPDPAAALAAMSRLLAPGGRAVIWHDNGRERLAAIHRAAGRAVERDLLPPARTLADLAREAGFSSLATHDEEGFYAVALVRR